MSEQTSRISHCVIYYRHVFLDANLSPTKIFYTQTFGARRCVLLEERKGVSWKNDMVYQVGSSRLIFYGINLATLAEVEEQILAFSNIAFTL